MGLTKNFNIRVKDNKKKKKSEETNGFTDIPHKNYSYQQNDL